jgi:DNA polymerase-3 subunit beta
MARSDPAEMQLSLSGDALRKALAHAQNVIDRAKKIPILGHVLLTALDEGVLVISANNLDMQISEAVSAEVAQAGAITADGQLLYEIARKLPAGQQVTMTLADGRLGVSAGRARSKLPTLPVSDFPLIRMDAPSASFELPAKALARAIGQVRFAIGDQPARPYLSGIYIHAAADGLRLAATDSLRLAATRIDLPEGAEKLKGAILPAKFIAELARLLGEQEDSTATLALSDRLVTASLDDITLTGKLIEGNYPQYERIIPQANTHVIVADADALADAVDRVATVSADKVRTMRLAVEGAQIALSAQSFEHGAMTDELDCEHEGDAFSVFFNSKHLIEQLRLIDGAATIAFGDKAGEAALFTTSAAPEAKWVLGTLGKEG